MNVYIVKLLQVFIIFIFSNAVCAEPSVIDWEDLSPTEAQGVKLKLDTKADVRGIPDISEFNNSKEYLDNFLDDMKFVKEMQEESGFINMNLNNKEIKIAGYITPIAFDGDNVTEFLFVPFRGACIHVPPPPANQIIYVKSASGLKADEIWSPQWITGTLLANSVSTIVADVGYSIQDASVQPYSNDINLFDLVK
jgi:uncharacterized protein